MSLPNCPKCGSEYTYEDGVLLVCPECAYEWEPGSEAEEGPVAIDNGNTKMVILYSHQRFKSERRPKDIKQANTCEEYCIVEGDHNIDCKIDGSAQRNSNLSLLKDLMGVPGQASLISS